MGWKKIVVLNLCLAAAIVVTVLSWKYASLPQPAPVPQPASYTPPSCTLYHLIVGGFAGLVGLAFAGFAGGWIFLGVRDRKDPPKEYRAIATQLAAVLTGVVAGFAAGAGLPRYGSSDVVPLPPVSLPAVVEDLEGFVEPKPAPLWSGELHHNAILQKKENRQSR